MCCGFPARIADDEDETLSDYLFPPPPVAALPIVGDSRLYPVARIFCVGPAA